jgi:hypothetical protein
MRAVLLTVARVVVLAAAGALLFHCVHDAHGPDAGTLNQALEVSK